MPRPRRADPPSAFWILGLHRLRGSISAGAVSSIADAIQTQEGYYPGSLSYQNNNPGNLVFAGQAGATLGAGGFAKFSSYAAGRSALEGQITLDATRGTDANGNPINDLSDLIYSWAPPSENNSAVYLSNVVNATGFDPSAPFSALDASAVTTPAVFSDLSAFGASMPSVDLSSLGIATPVSLPVAVGAGLVGLLILSRL